MKLTHKDFNVTLWDYERYTKLLRSEGAGGKLPVQTIENYQPLGGISSKQPQMGIIGIGWHYQIQHESQIVFWYKAEDKYWAVFDNLNDDKALDEMIKESWERYYATFEKRRMLVGIGDPLDDIENWKFEVVRESLKTYLASKAP